MSRQDTHPLVVGGRKIQAKTTATAAAAYFYHLDMKGQKVLRNTIYDIQISKSRPGRVTIDMNHWLSTTVKSDFKAKVLCKV